MPPSIMKVDNRFLNLLLVCSALVSALLFFASTWLSGLAWAASPTEVIAGITSGQIESKLKEIETTEELDDALKKKLIEIYRKTLSTLETTQQHENAAKSFAQTIETAPEEAKRIRSLLEHAKTGQPTAKSMGISSATPLMDLEQRLAKEQAELANVSAKLHEFEDQLRSLNERPLAVRTRLAEIKQLQKQISPELNAASRTGSPLLLEAQQWLLKARSNALHSESRMLDQELLSQAAKLELLQAQRDETLREIANHQALTNRLQELISERRRVEVEQAQAEAAEAEKEAIGKSPLIRNLAEQNAGLSKQLATLSAQLDRVRAEHEFVDKQVQQLEKDFESAQQKLQIGGLSQALGRALADERRRLPELHRFQKRASQREELIAEIGLRQIQHSEELRDLREQDPSQPLQAKGTSSSTAVPMPEESQTLLKNRQELLAKASDIDSALLRALAELEFSEQRLVDIAYEYKHFLDEHLLWIPSNRRLSLRTFSETPGAVLWLLTPRHWRVVGETLLQDAALLPVIPLTTLLTIAMILRYRSRMQAFIKGTANKVGRPTLDRFVYTFQALTATVLLAVPWPLLIAVLAWRLQTSEVSTDFAQLVGHGLSVTAPMLFNLLAFRSLCKPGGVAEVHFNWSTVALTTLRRQLDTLTAVSVPVAFVAVMAGTQPEQGYQDNLGFISYSVVMCALAYFFQRILNPKHGVLYGVLKSQPKGWLVRLQKLWYPLAIASPLALVVLASLGYFYTAGVLTRQLIDTLWLILGILVVKALVLRWLMLTRRKLALQAARERREAARAAREVGQSEEEPGLAPIEPEVLDLAAVDAQTRKLLNVGIGLSVAVGAWLIWSDVLPALGILDKVSIWQTTLSIDGEAKVVPITLADLGLATVIGILTAVASRNLPGVLELAILQRSGFDNGARYAVKTLTQYLIVTIGFSWVFRTVGLGWDQIQWLVAALGVGLGFGLQEIFGNFISGLIILFERPIRVGDIVTVGDTSGTVTRIRIRATTITNWDRKELLVPNKEFITGRLLNWTLSDQTNRIVITVGIAYGADVKKALQLMTEAAEEIEHILDDPPPISTFEGFGDNALTLTLRAYLGSLEFRLVTISALHEAINQKFIEAGIVIAFPQRDLHIDTARPLEIRLLRKPNATPSATSKKAALTNVVI